MRLFLLSLCLVASACVAQAGQSCEGGRCLLRPAVIVTKTVVRTTEKVVSAPRRVVRAIRCR